MPETFANSGYPDQDMELSVVHELLHLHMETFFPDKSQNHDKYVEAERSIELIAQTLVSQQREIRHLSKTTINSLKGG